MDAAEAKLILRQGLPLTDTRIVGPLMLRHHGVANDLCDSPIVIKNCVLDALDAAFIEFQAPVVLENVEVAGTCMFYHCFFLAGFAATHCHFRSGINLQFGGHNRDGSLFRIEDSEFDDFADFEDDWFEGRAIVRGCAFHGGANLLGMRGQPNQVTFDVEPIIEFNTGRLALDKAPPAN
jgi:hypothetical protein